MKNARVFLAIIPVVIIAFIFSIPGLVRSASRASVDQSSAPPASRAGAPELAGEYAPDRLLVRYAEGASASQKQQALDRSGTEVIYRSTLVPGLEIQRLEEEGGVAAAVQSLQALPYVLYAEPDYRLQSQVEPNDPSYGRLWGMVVINASAAWDITTGDPNFMVADIDSGIYASHPDLVENLWHNPDEIAGNGFDDDGNGYIDDSIGWDFVEIDNDPTDLQSHGTHTAGTIGAAGNNAIGVSGVNWNTQLMTVRFLDANGGGSYSDAILSLEYAVMEGAKISNNSYGGSEYSQAMYDAIAAARGRGHLFVAAAGNSSQDTDRYPAYPASFDLDNIISVAATDAYDALTTYSNYGRASVDLGAPGNSIYSTVPTGYGYKSGTSMAAPHVAGAAALVWGLHPNWNYQQVRQAILGSVRPSNDLRRITTSGGVLDAAAAVHYGLETLPTATHTGIAPTLTPTTISPSPSPTQTPTQFATLTAAPSATPTRTATTIPSATPTRTPTSIPSATPTQISTPSPTPGGNLSSHVGALSGAGTITSSSRWRAEVVVSVHDQAHQPLPGALVGGKWWYGGATETGACTTGPEGWCRVVMEYLPLSKAPSASFTVQNINHPAYPYAPGMDDIQPPGIVISAYGANPTATQPSPPTATQPLLPTATATPLPVTATATQTLAPTATNTLPSTATHTPLPTATQTPLPTATNTLPPTATLTSPPTPTRTATPTATKLPSPTPTADGSLTSHLGALSGTSEITSISRWKATVTVSAHTAGHQPLAGATVIGYWSYGATETAACITDTLGECRLVKDYFSTTKATSVTFTVTEISKPGYRYDPTQNDVLSPVIVIRAP